MIALSNFCFGRDVSDMSYSRVTTKSTSASLNMSLHSKYGGNSREGFYVRGRNVQYSENFIMRMTLLLSEIIAQDSFSKEGGIAFFLTYYLFIFN